MNPFSDASPDTALAALLQQAREITPRTHQLRAVKHSSDQALPGEVWLTQTTDEANGEPAEPLTVLLIDRFEGEVGEPSLFTAVPIFSDTRMAGPADAVLPQEILGFEAGIAFASAGSMLAENLVRCEGALPEDWTSKLIAFDEYVRGGALNPPSGVLTGAPYLDKNDPAFVFHEDLAEQMHALATSALEWATKPDAETALLAGPAKEASKAAEQLNAPVTAAASNELALAASTEVTPGFGEILQFGEHGARIRLSGQTGRRGIYRAKALDDPSHKLAGASLITREGVILAAFKPGEGITTGSLVTDAFEVPVEGVRHICIRLEDSSILTQQTEA